MSPLRSDTLIGDIDTLLCAVKTRLLGIADGSGAPSALPPTGAADHICAHVLDCVVALEQLHSMLADEVARRQRLEQTVVVDAQAALAHAPSELGAGPGPTPRLPPNDRLIARAAEPVHTA